MTDAIFIEIDIAANNWLGTVVAGDLTPTPANAGYGGASRAPTKGSTGFQPVSKQAGCLFYFIEPQSREKNGQYKVLDRL